MRNRSKLDLNDKFPEVLRMLWWKKEYLIEEHFYVKGRFKLHVPGSVQASLRQKFELYSEETGRTNQKSSTHKPLPRHILPGHTKGSASEYAVWAYLDYNHRVASMIFEAIADYRVVKRKQRRL